MKIKDIMTKEVLSLQPEDSVYEVVTILFDKNITGLPVVDKDKKVVGIITEYDLLSREKHIHIPTFLNLMGTFNVKDDKKTRQQIDKIKKLKVKDLMTVQVVTIKPESEIKEAARIFTEQHINPLPVVDGEDKLVGIVGRADVLKLFKLN